MRALAPAALWLLGSLASAAFAVAPASCAAATPVGTEGARVASRYRGEPLEVVDGSAPAPQERAASARYHVVAPGETLWSISRSYGSSVERVSAINQISDPTQIRAGQRLRIPDSTRPPSPRPSSDRGRADTEASPGTTSKTAPKGDEAPSKKLTTVPPTTVPTVTKRRSRAKPSKRYPLVWPVDGKVTSRYGKRWGRAHDGIDIAADEGTEVRAAASGEVLFSDRHGSYGNLVVIKHADRLVTVYAHHQRNLVRKGQRVEAGQLIGRVGQTGRATGPHLHFEVRRGTAPDNPMRLLPP